MCTYYLLLYICYDCLIWHLSVAINSVVPPGPCLILDGNTHSLCVVCLRAEHGQSALEGADCASFSSPML